MKPSSVLLSESLRKDRRTLALIIISLSLLGTLIVYEASSLQAHEATGEAAYFFKKQFLFLCIGVGLFFLTLLVDLNMLQRHNKELLIFTICLLGVVLLFGRKVGGARRWFSLGFISLQPSELLKISLLLYCSDYFTRKQRLIRDVRFGLLPLGLVFGIIAFFLLLQPDLGTTVFWALWMVLFLFLYRAKRKHLTALVIAGVICVAILVVVYPYRFRRITAYLNPFADPRGAGFQLIQSQIAYGTGGFWGMGLGAGHQKLFFLPAAHTDFIFSIIAEEFGFWGTMTLLSVFFFVFHKMFTIAKQSHDPFRGGILWGVAFIFSLEAIINIGVSCGLFPTKGLPLPFMSYGGSNLVTHYILLGLFFNASRPSRAQSMKVQHI